MNKFTHNVGRPLTGAIAPNARVTGATQTEHRNKRMRYITFKEVNQLLLPEASAYLKEWLPGGQLRGSEYVALNPTRHDRTLGSFSINLNTGKWADYATGDAGGDLISLYAYLNHMHQGEALKALACKLRLKGGRHG